jgi:hypothetical protein
VSFAITVTHTVRRIQVQAWNSSSTSRSGTAESNSRKERGPRTERRSSGNWRAQIGGCVAEKGVHVFQTDTACFWIEEVYWEAC